ncbi:MAG: hypothetical protein VX096_03995 [Pseudomonadota bacterium]|nr:hypothetical protein [Pseudomonadota bacterium]
MGVKNNRACPKSVATWPMSLIKTPIVENKYANRNKKGRYIKYRINKSIKLINTPL